MLSLLGPPAIDQAGHFEQQLPQTVEEFHTLPLVSSWLDENDTARTVQQWVQGLPSSIVDQTVSDAVTSLVGSVASAVILLAAVCAVMLDGEWLVGQTRRLGPALSTGAGVKHADLDRAEVRAATKHVADRPREPGDGVTANPRA